MESAQTDTSPNLAQLDFEQALAQLEEIVAQLEDGQLGLAESLRRYEQGVGLLRRCHEVLTQAERRIEVLTAIDSQGQARVEPFSVAGGETLFDKAASRGTRRSAKKPKPAADEPGDEPF